MMAKAKKKKAKVVEEPQPAVLPKMKSKKTNAVEKRQPAAITKTKKLKKTKAVEEPQPAADMTKTKKSKKMKAAEESELAATPKTKKSTKVKVEEESEPDAADDVQYPKYKEDIDAFSGVVEAGKDYISAMPSEILSEILSYLILDHDPDRAVKKHEKESKDEKFEEHSHVLLSLAAMSRYFRDHVEDFCHRHLTKNPHRWHARPSLKFEQHDRSHRRSERLKTKPKPNNTLSTVCYRSDLVKELQMSCIACEDWCDRRALMSNGVMCHFRCDTAQTISLSDARDRYDLQDWMLIPSRKPHLRAKQPYLPVIKYGTQRTGTPYCVGMIISYRFFEKDVKSVARAVHGDVKAHMVKKRAERLDRKIKKRDREHRKMKIRYHEAHIKRAQKTGGSNVEYHQDRLNFYQDLNCDEGYDSPGADHRYGNFEDVHKRLCINQNCERCDEAKFVKYSPYGM